MTWYKIGEKQPGFGARVLGVHLHRSGVMCTDIIARIGPGDQYQDEYYVTCPSTGSGYPVCKPLMWANIPKPSNTK